MICERRWWTLNPAVCLCTPTPGQPPLPCAVCACMRENPHLRSRTRTLARTHAHHIACTQHTAQHTRHTYWSMQHRCWQTTQFHKRKRADNRLSPLEGRSLRLQHYHVIPVCQSTAQFIQAQGWSPTTHTWSTTAPNGQHSPQIGWAFDGFPIFGPYTEGGVQPTVGGSKSTDTDSCYGHEEPGNSYGYEQAHCRCTVSVSLDSLHCKRSSLYKPGPRWSSQVSLSCTHYPRRDHACVPWVCLRGDCKSERRECSAAAAVR
jgi:hypothetical protein